MIIFFVIIFTSSSSANSTSFFLFMTWSLLFLSRFLSFSTVFSSCILFFINRATRFPLCKITSRLLSFSFVHLQSRKRERWLTCFTGIDIKSRHVTSNRSVSLSDSGRDNFFFFCVASFLVSLFFVSFFVFLFFVFEAESAKSTNLSK